MFTGLIEATGKILALSDSEAGTRITISAPSIAPRLRTGDSVAVSGVCLTALDITPTEFSAHLAAETVARTTLARLRPGSIVNLELPTPAGSPLGGHVVQGHVDSTGTLTKLQALHPGHEHTDWRLHLQIPPELTPYIVPQGSLTVEGISLTVAALHGQNVQIAVIPHTYQSTSLRTLLPGALLNLEVDILAKYAKLQPTAIPLFDLTERFLLAHGF